MPAALFHRAAALLAVALLGLHLLIASRVSFDDLRFAMMGAVALVAIVWSSADRMASKIQLGSILPAVVIFGFVLWRLAGQPGALAAGLAPWPLALALALLVGGWKRLGLFWREALVVTGLAISPFVETVVLELAGLDLAPSTAQFTAAILRLAGWNASARDVIVSLPEAWIVVSQGCSGLKTVYFLVGFSVVLLLVYPLPGAGRNSFVVLSAAAIGYFVNAVRVAILALMATPGHEAAFQFWHVKQGAMVFEILAVAVFLGLVYFIMPAHRAPPTPEVPRA